MTRFTLAIDVGGTFTDVICHDSTDGATRLEKTSSTPPDFIEGMLNGINALDIPVDQIGLIKIGTTIATNTIIMRTGARTALVTTAGFTDVLHAARAARPTLYDSDWDPAPALVERSNTMTVKERINYEGKVLDAIADSDLRELSKTLRERGIEAVAISFLHSYINGAHEEQARDLLSKELPGVYTCISSDILPEIREFERTSTTVANAYLGPVLEGYLSKLINRLEDIGYSGPVLITHSGGGVMSIDAARRIPARVCQSGPAAGVVAGANIGRQAERPDVIILDVGGTSADVSLSRSGRPLIRAEWNIEFNIVINFPSVDVATIGAGGGSIAHVDEGGVLKVGPTSAGARPGPACYDRGGTVPTVTDANLALGRLSPNTQLAGGLTLRTDLAEEALDRIAEPLSYKRHEAAAGILRIMRSNMAGAIRLMSVKRGHDPRDFSLVAFGGAGPLHAIELARELDIPEVIVPYAPGLGSALGVLFVEVRHDFVQSLFATNTQFDVHEINESFGSLENRAKERLLQEGVPEDEIYLRRELDIRYYGQVSGGLTLQVEPGTLLENDVHEIFDSFHARHTDEYGYTLPRDLAELEIVNARVTAEGRGSEIPTPVFQLENTAQPDPIAERLVYYDDQGWLNTSIYRREKLPVGFTIAGPAIIEQLDSTIVLPPHSEAKVDSQLNLICTTG